MSPEAAPPRTALAKAHSLDIALGVVPQPRRERFRDIDPPPQEPPANLAAAASNTTCARARSSSAISAVRAACNERDAEGELRRKLRINPTPSVAATDAGA